MRAFWIFCSCTRVASSEAEFATLVKNYLLHASVLQLLFEFMKLLILFWRCLIGIAFMGFIFGTTVRAGTQTDSNVQKTTSTRHFVKPKVERVVLVDVTGSLIPQRVVVYGTQANSGSPMYVIQGQELANTGAVSVGGLLSLEPSISVKPGPQRP
jgi:hypothetical protein